MKKRLTTILSIAGSDCTAGAGIQADIKAAAACGVYATTVLTAVTSQNSTGVSQIFNLPADVVYSQLSAVFAEAKPDAIKIGMIGSLEIGQVVVRFIKKHANDIPIVVDPVMSATSGGNLNSNINEFADFYTNDLLPIVSVATPNLKEAGIFLRRNLSDVDENTASQLLTLFKCNAVALKGGHCVGNEISDILATATPHGRHVFKTIKTARMDCDNLHGTGCTFASLLASQLAKGKPIQDAFENTGNMIRSFIKQSTGHILGHSSYGPLNTLGFSTQS